MASESKRKPGTWSSMSQGLKDRLAERSAREGISESAILRRSLMHELGVDANGEPVEGDRYGV